MRRSRDLTAIALGVALLLGSLPAAAKDPRIAKLPQRFRQWLEEVEPLISEPELEAFLGLEKDHQRDGFVEAFWRARDPNAATAANEYRDGYYARREEALARYGSRSVDRARVFLLNGDPSWILDYPQGCALLLWPVQIWRYRSSLLVPRDFTLFFYAPRGGEYRLWRPHEGFSALTALPVCKELDEPCATEIVAFATKLRQRCGNPEEVADISRALQQVSNEGRGGVVVAELRPRPKDEEWLDSFRSFSTERPEAAPELRAALELEFPSRHRSRTVVRGGIEVERAGLVPREFAGRSAYQLELTGEVLRAGVLFESFRYRFDLPPPEPGAEAVGLVFERFLRPGDYTLVVKLEDLGSGRVFREERALEVPRIGEEEPEEALAGGAPLDALATSDRPSVRIVPPDRSPLVGPVRFDAEVEGESVRRVRFLLDEQPVLTKTRPPFSVDLNLGSLPRTRALRVIALDARGTELASDELVVNPGEHAFAVRLVEPVRGRAAVGEVAVRAEVLVPEGAAVEQVELFLGEERLVTLFQEPWALRVEIPPGDELAYLRAVATLRDGRIAEDLVVVRGSPFQEEIEVRTVELYATVVDAAGRPVSGLSEDDFEVRENGRPQRLVRFAEVRDLPIHVVLLIDTSVSMGESLGAVRDAAYSFLSEALEPRDRAAVVTFSNEPRLAAPFTGELDRLAAALATIRPEQSTALHDSLVHGLYYLRGIQGQRALLVLSDGRDERSRHGLEEVLEMARGSGVTIYTLGLSLPATGVAARTTLRRLAEETGGRSLFAGGTAELAPWFASIAEELRSRYLLVYQSPDSRARDDFRSQEVRVRTPGLEVRAPLGYLP